MKLASLREGRDGSLIVVDSMLRRGLSAASVAPTLQAALDNWSTCAPKLQQLSDEIETHANAFDLDSKRLAAPLPRAYQWVDGSAYVTHVELVRKARGAEMPANFWTDPLMYQGCSDGFLGPCDDIPLMDEAWGIDFEAEIAVVTDDVPMGVTADQAAKHIKLLMLVNDVSLRGLIPAELGKGFGFLQSKPTSAFSPVAVTPDELGGAWNGKVLDRPLTSTYNGEKFGDPEAGKDMTFDFPRLISHAAMTRALCAGTIVGSGTVSNSSRDRGSSCLAERRMLEKIESGEFKTPFMKFGDRIRIEMFAPDGQSIFGAIDQRVVQYSPPA